MIDPPGGWLFGFPKRIPKDQQHRTLDWLVEQGYPKSMITERGFACRYWNASDGE